MSGIINHHSTKYEACVPNAPVLYMKQVNGKIHPSKCRVLKVETRGKHRNHLHRTHWLVYENDIERVIRMISRHNAELTERVKTLTLTAQDVDIIVRRATYKSLRLQLIPSAFCISGQQGADK